MKRLLSVALVATFALLAFSTFAHAGDQDFVLVNKTGKVIDKVWVCPSGTKKWSEDILGQDQLKDGETLKIKFHPKEEAAKWDVAIIFEGEKDEDYTVWEELNLMKIDKVTISFKDKKPWADVE